MHLSSLLRMQWFVENYLTGTDPTAILDIGSCDVNGSYKSNFEASHYSYIGLDMAPGKNVDLVPKNPYKWVELADNSFDVVISGQALEHIEFFWFTIAEMVRVLRPGGLLCIIAPRGFNRHRYPIDCYRFDADGMVALARYCNITPLHASTNLAPVGASADWYSGYRADSMLIAKKPENWTGVLDPATYEFKMIDLKAMATGFVEEPK